MKIKIKNLVRNTTLSRVLSIAILASCMICTISCDKETVNNVSNDAVINTVSYVYGLDKVPLVSNPHSVEEYTINSLDADDEKINKQLLEIGIATRELLKDNGFNETILKSASKNMNQTMNLNVLADIAATKSNTEESKALVNVLSKIDLTHKSTNPAKNGEIENYVPAIYVPNIAIADFNKQPIIALGFEVNTELSGMSEFENYIVAWYYDEQGNLNEILINEETAMNTTNPIFVIDNAEEIMSKRSAQLNNYSEPPQSKDLDPTTSYCTYEYQCNVRYETTGNTELAVSAAHITETGAVWLVCLNSGNWDAWKKIREIDPNDIGTLLYGWEQFCSNEVSPFSTNYVFWNTFERDWFNSLKALGEGTRNGTTVYLGGNRKYTGDWYAYDPGVVNSNPMDITTIYNSWAKWHDNTKSRLRIWRVNN